MWRPDPRRSHAHGQLLTPRTSSCPGVAVGDRLQGPAGTRPIMLRSPLRSGVLSVGRPHSGRPAKGPNKTPQVFTEKDLQGSGPAVQTVLFQGQPSKYKRIAP